MESTYQQLECRHCHHSQHCGHSCMDEACDHCTECACDRCQRESELDIDTDSI